MFAPTMFTAWLLSAQLCRRLLSTPSRQTRRDSCAKITAGHTIIAHGPTRGVSVPYGMSAACRRQSTTSYMDREMSWLASAIGGRQSSAQVDRDALVAA